MYSYFHQTLDEYTVINSFTNNRGRCLLTWSSGSPSIYIWINDYELDNRIDYCAVWLFPHICIAQIGGVTLYSLATFSSISFISYNFFIALFVSVFVSLNRVQIYMNVQVLRPIF